MTVKTLEMPKELETRLEDQARQKGESMNAIILAVLEEWLEDQEDIARAKEVMAEIRAGAMEVYPAEEVWERLGLED